MRHSLRSLVRACLPRRVGPRRILAGPLRDAVIVTSWHDYPAAILGRTERPLLDWFARHVRAGETWLDVGAHYGYTAIALCRLVGSSGRVFAFEPVLSTAGALGRTRRQNGFNQLVVLPVALGAPDTLEVRRSGSIRGMADSTAVGGQDEALLTVGLDWLWPRISAGNARVDGIKIDVQGMEIDVVRGALSVLRAHSPKLIVEVHPGVPRASLIDVLQRAGYHGAGVPIEPEAGEGQPAYLDDRSYVFSSVAEAGAST